ncbi:MAG: GNAT family N-acetyltransferase [Treponema sp.]|nr:GNAT family N-acetyltransferase [Treponema sp.]
MEVELVEGFTEEEYLDFRGGAGWTMVKPERVKELIKHSAFMVSAKVDGKTVGISRALFDYGYAVYISDVIVKPEYQGKGIGRKLVNYIIEKAKSYLAPDDYLMFVLVAAVGKSGFYEKLGFTKRTEENGWGMTIKLNAKKN